MMNIERINAILNIKNFDYTFKIVFSPSGGISYSFDFRDIKRLIFDANHNKLTEEECNLLAGDSFRFDELKRMLHDAAKECLCISKNGDFFVREEKYKDWRKLVMSNGQDVFGCSLNPSKFGKYNKCIIPTKTSSSINSSFTSGYAENHCHFNVAGPSFYYNWLFLHNGVSCFAPLKRMKNKKKDFLKYYSEADYYRLYNLCYLAIYLRLYIFRSFVNLKKKNKIADLSMLDVYPGFLEKKNLCYENLFIDEIKKISCSNHIRNKGIYDYCCNSTSTNQLFGERELLSNCFLKYDRASSHLQASFILYLIVRKYIESYFVQSNMWYGFNNFKRYERIFELFFPETKYVKKKIDNWTSSYLKDDDKDLGKLEVRLAPKLNYRKMLDRVIMCQSSLAKYKPLKTGLVLHFIKETQPLNCSNKIPIVPKCWGQIKQYERQLSTIKKMAICRNNKAMKLVGIDAANEEIRCRPEIFAPFYRAIRFLHKGIGQTFHVGEDFTSIIDGLRAIYEAVHFLDLRQGSRIGHGSALAVDIDKYYLLKGKQVISTKQDALDDFCFLYKFLCNIALTDETIAQLVPKLKLQEKAEELLEEIYGFIDFNAYVFSQELRGDHPDVYRSSPRANTFNQQLLLWTARRKEYYLDNHPNSSYKAAWSNQNSLNYIFDYHFAKMPRDKGNETCVNRVDNDLICAIKRVQNHLADIIASKGIGIETNPTSNYFIGPFVDFEDIPAIEFIEGSLSKKSLPVSVGTDDPGLFFTNIRNEYNSLTFYFKDKKYSNRIIAKKMKDLARKSMNLSFIK